MVAVCVGAVVGRWRSLVTKQSTVVGGENSCRWSVVEQLSIVVDKTIYWWWNKQQFSVSEQSTVVGTINGPWVVEQLLVLSGGTVVSCQRENNKG